MTAIALTIAGSDSSGGAGIQADLKTFSALHAYGASVITALTAQNTQGVDDVMVVPPEFVLAQMRSVMSDLTLNAIKIGMLGTAGVIDADRKSVV
jgi:hydroxymethylpyrimidine/phosphomethylpyrimidine kinase